MNKDCYLDNSTREYLFLEVATCSSSGTSSSGLSLKDLKTPNEASSLSSFKTGTQALKVPSFI